jgi:RecA/RadA recombinase
LLDTPLNRKYKAGLFAGRIWLGIFRNDRALSMNIDLGGIVVVTGNYGSGKTEVSVNLAVEKKAGGCDVRLADLDLVNPYFRSREARHQLRKLGIEVILPQEQYMAADLPILVPEVAGAIREQAATVILDAGGDDVGATVLAALADRIQGVRVTMLQVVNPFRPFTETFAGCKKIKAEIESASKMTMTGVVGNANLIDDTEVEHIYEGYDFALEYSRECGLKLAFITVPEILKPEIDTGHFTCPVLTIKRQLVPPWKRAVSLT